MQQPASTNSMQAAETQMPENLEPQHAHNFADISVFAPEHTVQRKAAPKTTSDATEPNLNARIQASAGSGTPLEPTIQTQLETGIGADLSGIRVHTDSEANKLSSELHANAFTTGNDIYFRQGLYNPNSSDGMRLLAHEATHTVQQANGAVDGISWGGGVKVSDPNDRFEQAAEATANNVMNSSSVGVAPTGGSSGAGVVQREAVVEEDEKEKLEKPEEDKELQLERDSSLVDLFIQREPTKPAQNDINRKYSFDFPEVKLGAKDWRYVKSDLKFKAKASLEFMDNNGQGKGVSAPFTVGPSGSLDGAGGKAEGDLAKQEFHGALGGMEFDGKSKEKFTFNLTTEKLEISAGAEAAIAWKKIPWLKALIEAKLSAISVKWAEVQKDPDKLKVGSLELSAGVKGEGPFTLSAGQVVQGSIAGQIAGSISPNWANVGAEVAEQAATKGAQTAATGGSAAGGGAATGATVTGSASTAGATGATVATDVIAIDTAAVASSAAAIILPAGAAALMIAGFLQTEKNIQASRAAIPTGIRLRREAKNYASDYASTITGNTRSGPGGLAANAKVMAYMASSGKNREDACADLSASNGGYKAIRDSILSQIKDQLYDKAVAEFEVSYASEFGLLEKLGETWGMRGVFRNDLRRILYVDE